MTLPTLFKEKLRGITFWLKATACAVVGWSILHGALSVDSATTGPVPPPSGAVGPGATQSAAVQPVAPAPAGQDARSAQALLAAPPAASPPAATAIRTSLAGDPALAGAQLALSRIDVIVTRNDTLDGIFRRLSLSLKDLASLRDLPGVRATLDRLRPGELLHLTHRDGELFGLERRLNESQTLKVSRNGSGLTAAVLQDALETRTRTVHGVIDHSLFEAVAAAGANDQTALALADIFGYDIDFVLDVQPGDAFAVTYQEIWRDGAYVKDGPIQAAQFVNQGHEYRAVRYADPSGAAHYYTPDGRSLHKAFLRAPVDFTRVSSRFNSARHHPILNLIRAHKGTDYAAPIGTPVHAAGDGKVRFAGRMGGYGNVVQLEHAGHITTVYGHLSRFARGIRVGAHVDQGAVIAYVGMTGLATGPHLHYEYRINGVARNPQTVVLPGATPIEARWRADFLAKAAPLLATLDGPAGPMLVAR